LLQDPAYCKKRICLFEADYRVGGRVLSVRLPEVPYVSELGAMRYIPEQVLTASLIEDRLKLDTTPFKFETLGYLLRGRFIPHEAFASPAGSENSTIPYQGLDPSERGKNPIELIVLAIQRALKNTELPVAVESAEEAKGTSVQKLRDKLKALNENSPPANLVKHFTAAEWRLIKRYGALFGRPLYQRGFWDLVQRQLSQEGYNLAHDGSGYQSILSMWNAADALVWYLADFTSSPYKTIAGGMGDLIKRLCSDISLWGKKHDGRGLDIFNKTWILKSVRLLDSKTKHIFKLTFNVGELKPASTGISTKIVMAEKVILALPQPALKAIHYENLKIDSNDSAARAALKFEVILDSVTANPLFKAFAIYEKPWWKSETSPSSFRVFTDLPIRQIYHFGTERQCASIKTNHDRSTTCILLMYCDARYAEYWKRMQRMTRNDQRYFSKEFERSISPSEQSEFHELLRRYGTGDAVRDEMEIQLQKVALKEVPAACTVILADWSDPPYFAGWHSWNMGSESWKIAERLVRPFLKAELYTCGEAFSSEQGWIEGALKSAERVLERLGVPPPDWVNSAIYEKQKELWL
jgi:hypothetical protein